MDVRSIEDVSPLVEHNGTVPVWWLVEPARDVRDHQGRPPRAGQRVRGRRRRPGRSAPPPDARVLLRDLGPRDHDIEGEEREIRQGDLVHIPPNTVHSLRPVSATTPRSTASRSPSAAPTAGPVNYTDH